MVYSSLAEICPLAEDEDLDWNVDDNSNDRKMNGPEKQIYEVRDKSLITW